MCLVEISVRGRKRLVTSCNYEAADGLEVETNSDRVRQSRKMTIELLLARCPEVPALQRLAKVYEVESARFPKEKDDCILCGLCVRVCRERMGVGAADFVGRGAEMRVDTPYERKSEACITCGACTFVCPTRLEAAGQGLPAQARAPADRVRHGHAAALHGLHPLPAGPAQHAGHRPGELRALHQRRLRHVRGGLPGEGHRLRRRRTRWSGSRPARSSSRRASASTTRSRSPSYSYGLAPNVLSSLQFERLLSASGPCMGNVVRPSDGKVPKRIAFVQCVGSRDEAHEWCSSVCCMYALKEAMIAKEHEHDVECTLFYMDIRAHGKGFDAYYERAKEHGHPVRPVPALAHRRAGVEEPERGLRARGRRDGGRGTTGDRPRSSTWWCSRAASSRPPRRGPWRAKFGIALDANGFGASPAFNPVASSRPGVFLAGPFSEPKDIPETVVEASSAAAEAMMLLAERRGTLVTKVDLPAETDIAGQVPRIGVFVCHCGKNIGAYVDVPAVREYAKTLPDRRLRHGQPVHLLLGRAGHHQGEDRRAPAEPGGGGLLLAAHARAAVPADHPRGRA